MPSSSPSAEQQYYARKLYALLRDPIENTSDYEALRQDISELPELKIWWDDCGHQAADIGSASDRVSLNQRKSDESDTSPIEVRHPISGQRQPIESPNICDQRIQKIVDVWNSFPSDISIEDKLKRLFLWCWRFYPEQRDCSKTALLNPAHRILPDCPIPSYNSTVSALTGAMFPPEWTKDSGKVERPYLLLFTFSPIQEFIKASRKFADFWAGSYLLHYLSARLCWHIADKYGPDAIIVPSLWGQDIVDAFLLEQYQEADNGFYRLLENQFRQNDKSKKTPIERFDGHTSTSLSTAGFPNVITALVPGLEAAKQLGQELTDELKKEWKDTGTKVRKHIGYRVREEITQSAESWNSLGQEIISGLAIALPQRQSLSEDWQSFGQAVRTAIRTLKESKEQDSDIPDKEVSDQERHSIFKQALENTLPNTPSLQSSPLLPYLNDLRKWLLDSNWEWNEIWEQQLKHSWEPYWTAVPLGNPKHDELEINKSDDAFGDWREAQQALSQAWLKIPSNAEIESFDSFNVGTWWGSFQQRLRIAIQTVKNTRTWAIPVAPGERSTISGQYSAVHPNLNYRIVKRHGEEKDFREGGGLPEGTMRLFWLLMAKAYPGLFNGSERLNALELTKRMAWQFGGVANSLGINISTTLEIELPDEAAQRLSIQTQLSDEDYERLIRFPNLSSIASARFMHDAIAEARQLAQGNTTNPVIAQPRHYWNILAGEIRQSFGNAQRNRFACRTRGRPYQVPKTDRQINPENTPGQDFNGVMFSSKWLAEEMNLDNVSSDNNPDNSDVAKLRRAVEQAHKLAGFENGSPADWWAIVLADGDGMSQYISGSKLKKYRRYIVKSQVDRSHLDKGHHQAARDQYAKFLKKTRKRMGPATHIGLNRALLDFSNRLVPYLTEKRFCGKVIYSGGDDVMAVLPIEDVPGYLRSLRAAWCGAADPENEFDDSGGYWQPKAGLTLEGVPNRPLFTMGNTATMSMGVVIAHKSVPLPTVLEHLWTAEKDRAKEMHDKDGICFRVIYSGGNTLEALMKGHLLDDWWQIAKQYKDDDHPYREELSPLLHRLAEELPQRAAVSYPDLFALAAQVVLNRRDEDRQITALEDPITIWLNAWAKWAYSASQTEPNSLGADSQALGQLLRFTAFWTDKMVQRQKWKYPAEAPTRTSAELSAIGR